MFLIFIITSACRQRPDFIHESYNLPENDTHQLIEHFRISEPVAGAFFSHIRKIHILSEGNVVVQNYPDVQLYEFRPDGKLVQVIGRSGRGPGEFIETFISHVTPGDSLHVYDFNNIRHQVLAKNDAGRWAYVRERVFQRSRLNLMQEQIPEDVSYDSENKLFGIFRIFPTGRDTLHAHYKYVSEIDMNVEHAGGVDHLMLEEELAVYRSKSSMSVFNSEFFYKIFYLFNPVREIVYVISNHSNEIVAIDSTGRKSVTGLLPFEKFPIDEKKLEETVQNVNYHFEEMEGIVNDKILSHEPYYRNALWHDGQLWIQITRTDNRKPNWIVSSPAGEVKKTFRGPEDIENVRIRGNRLYGSITNSDGEVFFAGFKLTVDTVQKSVSKKLN